MGLVRILAKMKSGLAWKNFETACRYPEAAQEKSWKTQLRLMESSKFWPARMPKSRRLEDFPITVYNDYLATLEDSYGAIISNLNGEEILHWAESTGTTGKRKMLPLTPTY